MTHQPSAGAPFQPEQSRATRAKRGRKPGPPRARLSVRVSQELYEQLHALALQHGAKLNDEAKQALEWWVHRGGRAQADEVPPPEGADEQ